MSTSYPPSYYAATSDGVHLRPRLQGHVSCDVAIVGAGFTGLSCGISLQEHGYETVVIDKAKVGWGASGRNGGHMVNGYSRDFDVIEKRHGFDTARAHAEMALKGSQIIRDFIKRYDIDCDYASGQLSTAITGKHERDLEERQRRWARYGLSHLKSLDRDTVRSYVNSPRYRSGLLDPEGGHIHPLNLALGEANTFSQRGGRIFEDTTMLTYKHDANRVVISTAEGSLAAKYLVMAGNAYAGQEMPVLWQKTMPCATSMIATNPLSQEQVKAILPKNVCVEDCAFILDYFRLSKDRRLLFGGGVAYSGKTSANDSLRLLGNLQRVFPDLPALRADYAWGGLFCLTPTRLPIIGLTEGNVYVAGGYSGHGVTTSHLAGSLIATAIQRDKTVLQPFERMDYGHFPGGRKLRIPLTVMGTLWYRLRDLWQF